MTTTTLSSTTIRVNWETIPAIDENGIIVTYEILYEPQETFNGEIMSNFSINTTDVSMLEMVLNGLQEFVDYNVTVRAYTSIGFGPFNPTGDSSRTFEDGELLKITYTIMHAILRVPLQFEFVFCSSYCCP